MRILHFLSDQYLTTQQFPVQNLLTVAFPKCFKCHLLLSIVSFKMQILVTLSHWIFFNESPKSFLIAGNVGTPEGVRELELAGADATKVGVGPGRVCITKLKTGFGTGGWQLAAVRLCAKAATKPIIADGGIRHNGDIAKAIRFGAHMVMIGSLLAAHIESPGASREIDGKVFKEYFGSASEYQKGEHKNVEGKIEMIPTRGHLADTLVEIQQDLQSSISYAGGNKLMSLRHVDYVLVRNTIYNGDR